MTDMNTSSDSRYSSPLREGQKSATRDLILEAVGRCLENAGLDELNFAQVAAEAQISDRTIYRHFPTKELLLEAFWKTLHGNLGINSFPATGAELVEMPERVFPYFDRHEQVLRGMLASRQGREVRLSVNDERQEAIRRSVRDAVGDLALAGGPILGRYTGVRAGHALTNRLLRALFADPTAWRAHDCVGLSSGKLPGVGVQRRDLPVFA